MRIVRATDTDHRDPVYKITVTLDFTEGSKLDSLTVIHTATSGATYSRSDQYEKAALWQTQGKKRILLEGYLEQGLCCHNSWRTGQHDGLQVGLYRAAVEVWTFNRKVP